MLLTELTKNNYRLTISIEKIHLTQCITYMYQRKNLGLTTVRSKCVHSLPREQCENSIKLQSGMRNSLKISIIFAVELENSVKESIDLQFSLRPM